MRSVSDLGRLLTHLLVLRPLLRIVFGVAVHGRSNLPRRGPFLLAANHNSHLDILLLFAALPLRRVSRAHAVAARDYFERNRVLFAVVNWLFQPVWVDRDRRGGDPLESMGSLLDAGDAVIIFPEGTRGEAGEIAEFHSGVGRLVESRREVPLVPAFLLGPERALPRKAPFPLPLWNHVFLGPPQELAGSPPDIVRALRESILALARSETAGRHRRRPERKDAFVVAVLGIDGSGKSTLATRLSVDCSRRQSTCLIGDRLELFEEGEARAAQPLLKEKLRAWISRRAKRAKSLAHYKIPKMTELLLRDALQGEARRWYGPDLIFMDGSPLLNMTAWAVLYREDLFDAELCTRALRIVTGQEEEGDRSVFEKFPELKAMKRLGLTKLALPDAVVFLDVDPAVCVARIDSRGEAKQVHETGEKLGRLREAYRLVVSVVESEFGRPALTLEGARELEENVAESRSFVETARGGGDE